MKVYDKLFLGGQWVAPSSGQTIEVISPATEEPVGRVPEALPADIDLAVAAAREAFESGPWPGYSPAERAGVLGKLSALLQARAEEIATTITAEMGSPITFSRIAQAYIPTMILDYYANLVPGYAFEEERRGVFGPTLVRREPVGVVAAIVPWNVPLFTAIAKLAPALSAGCTVVLKPAPETPLDTFVLADLLGEAGLPAGAVSIVPAGREVGEYLVTHPGIDKVSFTGSTAAGRRIAA
ncbi:MAG: aldehyde dehydrogenase family protein, partial [Mycobacteriales bacterium]